MVDSDHPLLSVGIISFNQEEYIRQCIESVLMQDTSFNYEIIVGDDHSTDSTPDILKEYQRLYPNLFVLILNEENTGISENFKAVLNRCRGKYIALCEGDDYWTDSHKLQMQFDFLEKHVDYGFVGSRTMLLFPDGSMKSDYYSHPTIVEQEGEWNLYGRVFEDAKYGPVTRTVSICFRKSLIEPFIHIAGSGNDMVLQSILAYQSCFAEYERPLCIYRQGGVSTDRLALDKQLYYNQWYVRNRLLQKSLFPVDCDWDEQELLDRENYILLKDAIRRFRPRKAMSFKKRIVSNKYRQKSYSRNLHGFISCLILSILLKHS